MAKAKLLPGLSADTALKDAATAILLTRADEVVENLGEFFEDESATALHASRTAVRRLRTALTTLGRPLHEDDRAVALEKLTRLFKRLGRARDLDVQLQLLGSSAPRLRRKLSEQRQRRYRKALKAAKRLLRGELIAGLRAAVTDTLVLRAQGLGPEFQGKTLKTGADAILTPLTDDLLRRIKQARDSDDPESLHRLRLAVKSERDVLEMFSGALPQLGGWQKRLAALAAVLGELHDVDVLLERVAERRAKAKRRQREELDRLEKRARQIRARLASESESRLSAQALQRLDTDLRNARAGAFFADPTVIH